MRLARADAFIGVWLAAQLALPLHYYALREDPRDERFAWRMFSSLSERPCRARFEVGSREVDPSAFFADAWVRMAGMGRQHVTRRMAGALCERFPGEAVSVRVECPDAEGAPLAAVDEADACQDPAR